MHVAVSYHLVARTQSCMGEFRAALNNEKETYSIYKSQVSSWTNFFDLRGKLVFHDYSWEKRTKRLVNRQNAFGFLHNKLYFYNVK